MNVNSVNTNSQTDSTNGSDSTNSLGTQMLSEQDFLNLLVAQMTAQDPLNPMTNQDMLSQMVQFSTLNANTTMQTTLGSLQDSQNLTQGNALIGRQVTLLVDSSGATAQGVVTGVQMNSGTPQIVVNGTAYDLSQVTSISAPSANPATPTP